MPRFNVILTGSVQPGANPQKALKALASLLNTDESRASQYLGGEPKIIKKNVTKEQAQKYKFLLASYGITAKLGASAGERVRAPGVSTREPQKTAKVLHISEAMARKKSLKGESKVDAPIKKSRASVTEPAESSQLKENTIFRQPIQHQAASLSQQFSLLGSCCALLVAAVFYLGLVCSLAFFALARLFSLFFVSEGGVLSSIFVYLLPFVVSAGLCALLLRPILNLRKVESGVCIPLDKERSLKSLIRQIVRMLDAPMPTKIVLTDETEISAEFEPSFKDLKQGNIQLRIGMPMLMVSSFSELAAALTGSLSKFDDRLGMYMQFLVRESNRRFTQVYGDDDGWRQRADAFVSTRSGFYVTALTKALNAILKVSALLAYPPMMLVRLLTARTSRLMTYRSDDYSSNVAGVRSFVGFFGLQAKLQYACNEANSNLHTNGNAQRFVNDLPALILHAYKNLSPAILNQINEEVVSDSTRWDDLAPSNRDRMITAEDRSEAAGIVEVNADAYQVLGNLKSLSRQFSLAYYRACGFEVEESQLVDAKTLATSSNEERKRDEICRQYFNGWFEKDIFWQTNQFTYAKSISRQQRIVEINECIKMLRSTSPDFMHSKIEVPEKFNRYTQSRLATEVHKAGYRFDDIQGLENVSVGGLSSFHSRQRKEYEGRRAHQRDLCRVMGERLCFALAFLKNERERKVSEVVLGMLSVLEAQANQLETLRSSIYLVPQYKERIKAKGEREHSRRLRRLSREVLSAYQICLSECERYRWPFGKEHETLADYLAYHIPNIDTNANDDVSSGRSAAQILESRVELYNALWNALCETNRFLNGKLAPLAQKAELENSISRIKMAISNQQAG